MIDVAASRQMVSEPTPRNRPKQSFTLDPESIRIITAVAIRHDEPMSRAVVRIVKEWHNLKFGRRS